MASTGRLGIEQSRLANIYLGETAPVTPTKKFLADWRAGVLGAPSTAQIAEFNRQTKEEPSRIQFVKWPLRQGDLALKMTVKEGDVDAGSTERVQIATFNSTPSPQYSLKDGDDVWIAFSVYLASSFAFPASSTKFITILDGFANTTDLAHTANVTHALDLAWTAGGPEWTLNINGGVSTEGGASGSFPHETRQKFAKATIGHYNDFLMHTKMSTGGDGVVEIWYAPGAKAEFSETPNAIDRGPNVATADNYVCVMFPEFGIYRSKNPQTSDMYLGGVAISSSKAEALAVLPSSYFPGGLPAQLPLSRRNRIMNP
jgi:hypothetical protein